MSSNIFYLISLPASAAPSGGDPETQLEKWYSETLSVAPQDINPLQIPSFKIGTLDSLVQQSEELAKIDTQFQGIVSKVSEIVSNLYDGNIAQISAAKKIDDKSAVDYIKSFSWSSNKYRTDKPIPELVDLISKVFKKKTQFC